MTGEVLIDVRGVRKKYCRSLRTSMKYGVSDILGDILGRAPSSALRKDEFYATDDVSLTVRRGECLGLIGANGAGKSTLLKLINGIFLPDAGSIEVRGKVGALIEVGAGFHPLLSGRENIYISGAIQGMSKAEIDSKLDSIIAFSGLDEFIDMPIKSYSSGMYVRLGFAVAVHLEPDVLIIDEVLAVGDMAFRSKCYEAIDQLRKQCAIIFVSHNMQQIGRVCDRACFLERGKVAYQGDTAAAINQLNQGAMEAVGRETEEAGSGGVRVLDLAMRAGGETISSIRHGESFEVEVSLEAEREITDAVVNIGFSTTDDALVMQCTNQGEGGVHLQSGRNVVCATIDAIPLISGIYYVTLLVQSSDLLVPYVWIKRITSLVVKSDIGSNAPVRLPVSWSVGQD